MISDITNIIYGTKACGVNIFINGDDQMQINSLMVERKGKRLVCSNISTSFSPDELKKNLSGNIPIYLSIDGKGIIHKITDKKPGSSPIDSLFPGARTSDFLVQETLINNNKSVISAIRREKADEIISMINVMGYDVLKILLGPFAVINISNSVSDEASIDLPFYNISIKTGQISGYEKLNLEKRNFSINIDSHVIDSEYIVPFSSCLFHFRENENISVEYSPIHLQKDNFKFRKLFHLTGWVFLIIFFLGLLGNYFLLENYRRKNEIYSLQINSNKEVLVRIGKLKKQLKTREEFYSKSLSNNNQTYAYYFDKIAQVIPLNITLTRFCISPVIVSRSNQKSLIFQNQKMLISGFTMSSNSLDSWIRSVRILPWINEITIKSFTDNNIDAAKFDLEISINGKSK